MFLHSNYLYDLEMNQNLLYGRFKWFDQKNNN